MRLIEREDLRYIGVEGWPYHLTLEEDGSERPGPFLFCVNDTGAWISRYDEITRGHHCAPMNTATVKPDRYWRKALKVWLRGESINQAQLFRRYKEMRQALREIGPRVWSRWEDVYHWGEGSDLMWDGLSVHEFITRREVDGVREVVWTGTSSDQRYREREEARHARQ